MNRYTEQGVEDFERVVRCDNSRVGYSAWIAVHNSFRGPALGGCRIWPYASDRDALVDVLRLSRGMTYKNALARLALGGGKCAVRTDLNAVNREALFEAIGEFVEYLDGDYITAEDVNTTVADMAIVKRKTRHVATVGASGNPSPFTAYGVYCAIEAAVRHCFGTQDLNGLRIAIQGVGETGGRLAERLFQAGCSLIVADINPENIGRISRKYRCRVVGPEAIHATECDVFSPCALGGILNPQTIPQLRCSIVAGSANNQLLTNSDGSRLHKRGILYVPDYAANAGGVINISCEIGQPYAQEEAYRKTAEIGKTVEEILKLSAKRNKPTNEIADQIAEKLISDGVPA